MPTPATPSAGSISVPSTRSWGKGKRLWTRDAIELSPLDPQRYYFESLGATAEVSAHQYENAERLARSSLVLHRMHPSTWRALTISLVAQDRMDEARETLARVRQLEPQLTVERSRAHAECGARNRTAMGALPGNGGAALGKRQLEPALILEKNILLV